MTFTMLRSDSRTRLLAGLLCAAALAGVTSPAAAQYGAAPLRPAPAGYVESPADALVRHLRQLAVSPRDLAALLGAGRAALELGDTQAAAGFFGRAEESYPTMAAPKVGLGAAMVQMSDAQGAMRYFDQAARLGATAATMALDRGMARDLLGDLGAAQSDYRLALFGPSGDEARRRLALSLAIARDRKGALDALQPLLTRRDPAAQRVRAFVLALTGDRVGATQAIELAMPGAGARFDPFFRYLPNLSIAEKAAAVHLGLFPEDAATRVAQATPLPAPVKPAPRPTFTATARPAPPPVQPPPVVKLARRDPVVTKPALAPASPSFSLPSATSAAPTVLPPAPIVTAAATPIVAVPVPTPPASEPVVETQLAAPAFSIVDLPAGDARLSGIDKLLATIAEAPPPPQPKVEAPTPPSKGAKDAKTAAAKKAADKKVAEKKAKDDKLAAEKKAKEEAAKLGVAGANWVQLAGGSNQDRMVTEYRRLAAKAGSALKRPGYVTGGKDYFRLLVGPFDSKGDAQAFVNKLAKEGVDGFSWTRNPPQIRIEKLPSK